MWLVAGLGNPGVKYKFTRHNVGFMFIDRICNLWEIRLKEYESFMMERALIEQRDLILLKPMTFMNRSGVAVKKVCEDFKIQPEEVIVVHDDIDMELGKVRIRKRGSSGGHRGVQSIIEVIGENFTRIKIGIGRDRTIPAEEYVLGRFSEEELKIIDDAIERAIKRLFEIIPID